MSNSTYVANQFKQTRDMFAGYIGLDAEITFQDWDNQPEDLKAATLFVAFYDQITLAWYKTKGEHTYEEDGVDEAMHICSKLCGLSTKQSDVIKAACGCTITIKTFTPAYIFNAMRNAFSSLNYERKSTRSCYQHPNDEITVQGQFFTDGTGEEQDIFDCLTNGQTMQETIEHKDFWAIIESVDNDTEMVIAKLLEIDDAIRAGRVEISKANTAYAKVLDKEYKNEFERKEAIAKAEERIAAKVKYVENKIASRSRFVSRKENASIINILKSSLSEYAMA